jgi:hypothetical protein
VLVDTGIVYALADKRDAWHKRAADYIAKFEGKLTIPSTVIPEACYLLGAYLGQSAEIGFVNSLLKRELIIEHHRENDLKRCIELMKQYQDLNIGFVDASIVAVSERLKIQKILTTDRRHFSTVKPDHCDGFTLLP